MTIEIRAAGPDDARAVAEVRAAGWRRAYDGLVPAEFLAAMDPAADAERYRAVWSSGGRYPRTAVALADGAVIGFATWGPYHVQPYHVQPYHGEIGAGAPADGAAGVGELMGLYVQPGHWGSVAGHALLTHTLADLAEASLAPVRLWVLAGNGRARRFYERAGFRADGASALFPVAGAEVPEVRYSRP